MSIRIKVISAAGSLALGLLLALIIWYYSANDLGVLLRQSEPFGIRIALIDNSQADTELTAALGQLLVFPEQKRLLLYSANTDARYEADASPLAEQSPFSADQFKEYTDLRNSYYITLTTQSLQRIIDLAGGTTIFLEDNLIFDQQDYSYPHGVLLMSGEQVVEFMLARHTEQPDRAWLNGVDRLRRMESMLLNLYWHRKQWQRSFEQKETAELALSWIETDLGLSEMETLLAFVSAADVHLAVQELPMKQEIGPNGPTLLIKAKSARIIYNSYKEDVLSGRDRPDNFPVEVLNGTETGGMARRVKQFLQDRGLQVLDADNYRYKPLQHSSIVERSGDTWHAHHLMELTGIKPRYVSFKRQPMDVEGSFIIGTDFKINQLTSK
ncbi:MAG: LCP family protein [Leptospiraceae bacterium]|nr:LCP family protein [Leptospiraceae bacterium]